MDELTPGTRARLTGADYPGALEVYGYHRYVGQVVTVTGDVFGGRLPRVEVLVHDDLLGARRQVVETRHLQVMPAASEATS